MGSDVSLDVRVSQLKSADPRCVTHEPPWEKSRLHGDQPCISDIVWGLGRAACGAGDGRHRPNSETQEEGKAPLPLPSNSGSWESPEVTDGLIAREISWAVNTPLLRFSAFWLTSGGLVLQANTDFLFGNTEGLFHPENQDK